jgi:putative methionine-R-sulfoxide reductase with GAF domain
MKKRKIKHLLYAVFSIIAIIIIFTRSREILIFRTLENLNQEKNKINEARLILHENEILMASLNSMLPVVMKTSDMTDLKTFSAQNQDLHNKIVHNFQRLSTLEEIKTPIYAKEYFERSNALQQLLLEDYKTRYLNLFQKKESRIRLEDIYPESSPLKKEIEITLDESLDLLYTGLIETHDAASVEFTQLNKIIDQNNKYADDYLKKKYRNAKLVGALLLLFLFIVFIISVRYLTRYFLSPINKIQMHLDRITLGELPEKPEITENEELKQIGLSINKVVEGLRKGAEFSEQIGKGNFDVKYRLLSENDVLGTSLLTLRDNLQNAKLEEEKRKKEDEQRNRTNVGLTLFADILRQHPENLNLLADKIISALVKFLDANQGAIFYLNDSDKANVYYELIGAFAYNRKKYLNKQIKPGEGLVGAVAIEKYTVYMTDIPDDYIEIESGTGSANPRSVLIIPLKMEENVLGVIELASFNRFEKYEIEMAEKIAESISSSLANTSINMQTIALLEKSKDMEMAVLDQEKELIENE